MNTSLNSRAAVSYEEPMKEKKGGICKSEPSTLLATIAAPGIAPEATAASKVDSIEGIACNLTESSTALKFR
jgi:hypothetical protein